MRMTLLALGLLACLPLQSLFAQPPGGGPNPEEMKKRMMQMFDTNGDGQIDENEKKVAAEAMQQRMLQAIQSGNLPDEMKARLDRNGDGTVDAQELAMAKEMMGRMQQGGGGGLGKGGPGAGGFGGAGGTGDQIPADVLKKFDKNKDGQLDETEKKAALEAMNGKTKSRAQQLKDKLDTNNDGKIDDAERAAAKEAFKAKGKK